MTKLTWSLAGSAACLAFASASFAGGIERNPQTVQFLFEEGRYAEFTYTRLDPDVSGTLVPAPVISTGDMIDSENLVGLYYKQDLGENWVLAFSSVQPYGVRTAYPTGTGHPFAGSNAELDTRDFTAYLKYAFGNGFSAYGGLRFQQVEGQVFLPSIPGGYNLSTNNDREVGYAVGVAYERPDIALRVALTYNSAIDHTFESSETLAIGTVNSEFETTLPQSVNLEFQTGIMEDTLLFGSIRWVDWSEFTIAPPVYSSLVPYALAGYESDTVTYKLGVGRRFNDNWSGAITLTHEPQTNDIFGNLGPVDGRTGLGVGATYTQGNMKVSAGIEYNWLGDALTQNPRGAPGDPISDFQDNTAINLGIRVGFYF